jgi:hypothetical protein
VREALLAEAVAALSPTILRVQARNGGFVVDLLTGDGSVLWPDYAHGPDELLAVLAAEQRFLVED